MKFFIQFLIILTFASPVYADYTVSSQIKTDALSFNKDSFLRVFLKNNLTYSKSRYKIVSELFADGNLVYNDKPELFDFYKSHFAVQELYYEINWSAFYVKIGTQSLRWSEMWILPSLDIWTGRRWERFLIDPQSDQLSNPSGLLLSLAPENWSIDVFVPTHLATNTHPTNLESLNTDTNVEKDWGARFKLSLFDFNLSVVQAELNEQKVSGGSLNYAFDEFVPKFEFIQTVQEKNKLQSTGFGLDIFIGDFNLFTQLNFYRNHDESSGVEVDTTGIGRYLNLRYTYDKHIFEYLYFKSILKLNDIESNLGSLTSIQYEYQFKNPWSFLVYAQTYEGEVTGAVFTEYQNLTDKNLVGLRLEYKN